MKHLKLYIECDVATPANTMGMGNPGETAPGELSEPIGKAYAAKEKIDIDEPDRKKKKKKKIKSLTESIFDDELSKQGVKLGVLYRLDRWADFEYKNETFIENVLNASINESMIPRIIAKSKWKNHLKSLKQFPPVSMYKSSCKDDLFLTTLTEIILCCESLDEVRKKINEFIKESRMDEKTYKEQYKQNHPGDDLHQALLDYDQYHAKNIDIYALNNSEQLLRMVLMTFMTKSEKIVIASVYEKRD